MLETVNSRRCFADPMYGQIDGVHVKRENHEDVRVCGSDDIVHLTECGGVLELHHSRICLLLVAVESGEFVHLDLNCNKALRLGLSHKSTLPFEATS